MDIPLMPVEDRTQMSPPATGTPDLSFRAALRRLDAAGRLMKVETPVDAHLELTGILFHELGSSAVLFKQVKGNVLEAFTIAEFEGAGDEAAHHFDAD